MNIVFENNKFIPHFKIDRSGRKKEFIRKKMINTINDTIER